MDTLHPAGTPLWLTLPLPFPWPTIPQSLAGLRLQCVTFGLIIFGCKMSAKVKAKLTFQHTCVCVCVCCVSVCGSNFIIGFPSAIKILRIFKSIYSSDVPCPALGLGESNERQWHKLPSKLTLELPSGWATNQVDLDQLGGRNMVADFGYKLLVS